MRKFNHHADVFLLHLQIKIGGNNKYMKYARVREYISMYVLFEGSVNIEHVANLPQTKELRHMFQEGFCGHVRCEEKLCYMSGEGFDKTKQC